MVKRRVNNKTHVGTLESDLTSRELGYMTREQLKSLLKERGLPISGNKANMIARLEGIMETKQPTSRRAKDSSNSNGTTQRSMVEESSMRSNNRSKLNKDNDSIDPDSLTLWHHPIITVNYFLRELFINITDLFQRIFKYKKIVWSIFLLIGLFIALRYTSGPHQQILKSWESVVLWWLYWVGLGVLSSVGLGTGLHTFVLYLGPHIAAVTIAAYECGGLNFPEPPYPDSITCPVTVDTAWSASILNIMRKVRVEAMLWGAGTALGELPPYFMARAARNSRQTDRSHEYGDQEDLKELEALEALETGENVPLMMRLKLAMKHFVQKAGFLGILACASIPNPLFDLAGLTCGHYRIPFWTFFGATLIGKAIVKMHIQQLAVIIAFNEELLDKAIGFLAMIPYIGHKFQGPIKKYLIEQKNKLHNKNVDSTTTISWLFDKFVFLMVCYFLVTIVHALARNHHRRRVKSSLD